MESAFKHSGFWTTESLDSSLGSAESDMTKVCIAACKNYMQKNASRPSPPTIGGVTKQRGQMKGVAQMTTTLNNSY